LLPTRFRLFFFLLLISKSPQSFGPWRSGERSGFPNSLPCFFFFDSSSLPPGFCLARRLASLTVDLQDTCYQAVFEQISFGSVASLAPYMLSLVPPTILSVPPGPLRDFAVSVNEPAYCFSLPIKQFPPFQSNFLVRRFFNFRLLFFPSRSSWTTSSGED